MPGCWLPNPGDTGWRCDGAAGRLEPISNDAWRDHHSVKSLSLEAKLALLKQVSLFANIEDSKLKLLALTSESVTFDRGQSLFRQGGPSDVACVIVEGQAEAVWEGDGDEPGFRAAPGEGCFCASHRGVSPDCRGDHPRTRPGHTRTTQERGAANAARRWADDDSGAE